MELSLLSSAGTGQSTNLPRTVIPAELLQLLQPSPQAQTQRAESLDEQRDERRRRRNSARQDLLAATATTTRPAQTALEAEREMSPGSRAARSAQVESQAREQATPQRQEFRQALAEASQGRESGTRASETADLTPATKAAQATSANESSGTAADSGTPPSADPVKPAASPAPVRSAAETQPAATTPARGPVPTAAAVTAPVAGAAIPSTRGAAAAARVAATASAAVRAVQPTGSSSGSTGGGERAAPQTASVGSVRADAAARTDTPKAAPATAPEPSNTDANVEQIVRLIHARLGHDRSVATLRLDPPELGKLRMKMNLRNEQLALEIDAETPAAQRLLTEQVETLRRSLAASGIHLERVDVRVPEVAQSSVDGQLPPRPDAWTGAGQGSSRGDGEATTSRSAPVDPSAMAGLADGPVEAESNRMPAAESLVDVWA